MATRIMSRLGRCFGTVTKLDAAAGGGVGRRAGGAGVDTPSRWWRLGGSRLRTAAVCAMRGRISCAVISGLLVQGRTVESVARDFLDRLG